MVLISFGGVNGRAIQLACTTIHAAVLTTDRTAVGQHTAAH
ncbi:hypothetical protein [Flexibacter flexilis]|nr:hypothetical protein [Flexibacter flexilis]